jgi:hypothetical protein
MSEFPDSLARVETLLQGVLGLTQHVIANKHAWKASPDEASLLHEAASVMGRPLAPEALNSVTGALAFLLMAKFALEALRDGIRGPVA